MIGALVRVGRPALVHGRPLARRVVRGGRRRPRPPGGGGRPPAGAVFRLHDRRPPIGPGSWRSPCAASHPADRHTPAAVVTGWLPRGIVSTDPLKEQIRRVVPEGWSPTPTCGSSPATTRPASASPSAARTRPRRARRRRRRVVRDPGFYRPVEIGGRRYVDGGVHSASNLDLLRDLDLDVAICLNPTSTLHPIRALNPRQWPRLVTHRPSGRRLGSEAKRLRAGGTDVVLIQPTRDDLAVMGTNLMSTSGATRSSPSPPDRHRAAPRPRGPRAARRPAARRAREDAPPRRASVAVAQATRPHRPHPGRGTQPSAESTAA